MASPEEQTATQIANIERSTGVTVAGWAQQVAKAGCSKHGEIVTWLKANGLTHGNANALAHAIRNHLNGGPVSGDALLDAQYSGAKAALRPILDELVRLAGELGDDVDVVVQKTAVSLRRGKQFAMVEVPSSKRVRLGFNLRGAPPTGRVVDATGMCTHRMDIASLDDVDDEVITWLSSAYTAAGPRG